MRPIIFSLSIYLTILLDDRLFTDESLNLNSSGRGSQDGPGSGYIMTKTQIAIFKLRFCYLGTRQNENDTCRGRF